MNPLTGRYCTVPPWDASARDVIEAAISEAGCHQFDGTLDETEASFVLRALDWYGYTVAKDSTNG